MLTVREVFKNGWISPQHTNMEMVRKKRNILHPYYSGEVTKNRSGQCCSFLIGFKIVRRSITASLAGELIIVKPSSGLSCMQLHPHTSILLYK